MVAAAYTAVDKHPEHCAYTYVPAFMLMVFLIIAFLIGVRWNLREVLLPFPCKEVG